ncbi:MAG TPA: hypothetical protein VLA12_06500, partial [Planctomycetaceae bacterium]|nr:hypothetical protein [Planctomycetaceae bacterium]
MDSELLEGNEYPRGPLVPVPVIAILLLLLAIPVVFVLTSFESTPNETELFAAEQKANPMKNR